MARSTMKRLAVFAVGAVAGFAGVASAAQADTWKIDGVPVTSATPLLEATGSLDFQFLGTSLRIVCPEVTFDAELNANAGVVVNDATFTDCAAIHYPGCAVEIDAASSSVPSYATLPWAGTGDASTQTVDIADVRLVGTFGPECPGIYAAYPMPLQGSLSPTFDVGSQSLSFDDNSNSALTWPGSGMSPTVRGGVSFYADDDGGLTLE